MLIVNVKNNESIERALRRYRRKHRDVGLRDELRRRKHFIKPSVKRRKEVLKAEYIEQKRMEAE